MPYVIVIVIVVVVVVAIIGFVGLGRSRSAKSDWLGELSEIRRSSLGDDEEVTGALDAIGDDEGADTDEESVHADPPTGDEAGEVPGGVPGDVSGGVPEPDGDDEQVDNDDPQHLGATESDRVDDATEPGTHENASATPPALQMVATAPDRTVTDAGTLFYEYRRPADGLLRVEATDPDGLRVLISQDDVDSAHCAVNLPIGVLWYRGTSDEGGDSCTVRTPGGWVVAVGTVLVLVGPEWSYAMCLAGTALIRSDDGDKRVHVTEGQIARFHRESSEAEVAEVGPDAFASEGVVRRQRRLDGKRPTQA